MLAKVFLRDIKRTINEHGRLKKRLYKSSASHLSLSLHDITVYECKQRAVKLSVGDDRVCQASLSDPVILGQQTGSNRLCFFHCK